ncbi:hypothetical protein ADUPG1_006014 [Aduncisulcus paluster]|uniref:Fido domain-containing protein n=1 Tax=Aduncisulcus paluster TaxID=2918883 RepID=A0ABQ5KGH1_9EUKA|nr:hypothetical protein ADUPG1_006014 [Aduncisulcus paluster]
MDPKSDFELEWWWCSDSEPQKVAKILLYEQVAIIHPFMDGNGRLTRLLTNYILRYCGCPVPVPLCSAESGITRLG